MSSTYAEPLDRLDGVLDELAYARLPRTWVTT
jgi:hypothetical protein